MKTMVMAAAIGALLAQGSTARAQEKEKMSKGSEIWAFVLNKDGTCPDLKGATATLTIRPVGGEQKSVVMTPTSYQKPEKGEKRDADKGYRKMLKDAEHMLCGEVKPMDPYWVELLVVTPAMKRHFMEGKPMKDGDDKGKGQESGGLIHTHNGPFFAIGLNEELLGGAWGQPLSFSADIQFAIGGEAKSATGFSFPLGFTNDLLGRLINDDLEGLTGQVRQGRLANLKPTGEKIVEAIESVPALSFAKDSDKDEYEKARTNALVAARQLIDTRMGEDKEIAQKCINDCTASLRELRSQAGDSQGAVLEKP